MRVHKCILTALVLAAAMTYGITAMAADFPKEGTYSGTYTGVGTVKATAIGTDRLLVAFDVTGVLLSNGFTEHMTLHCWGTSDFTKGIIQRHVCRQRHVQGSPVGKERIMVACDELSLTVPLGLDST